MYEERKGYIVNKKSLNILHGSLKALIDIVTY